MLTPLATKEVRELSFEAERLTKGGASDRARAQVLMQRIKFITETTHCSSDESRMKYAEGIRQELGLRPAAEEHRSKIDAYVRGRIDEAELRTWEAGQQTLGYSVGGEGGFLVPQFFDDELLAVQRNIGPLLNQNITDYIQYPTENCNPITIPSYDLSTITAAVIAEAAQLTPLTTPTAYASLQNPVHLRCCLVSTIEAEQDVSDFSERMFKAGMTAIYRAAMMEVLSGSGSGGHINGVTKALSSTLTNSAGGAGKLALGDLTSLFFALDKFWRDSARCFFAMPDACVKMLANAIDGQGRPLLDVTHGQALLFDKPVFVCPELTTANCGVGSVGAIIFGSGDGIVARAGRPVWQRTIQTGGSGGLYNSIEKGESLHIFRMRLSAQYFDASASNANPPLVIMAVS